LDLDPLTGTDQGVLQAADDHPFRFNGMIAVDAVSVMGVPVGVVHVFLAV
jgi:hypothetical protein